MDDAILDAEEEPRARPTGVAIIAVLAMVSGIFTFCFAPFGFGQMIFQNDPIHLALRRDPMFHLMIARGVLGWFFSIISMTLGFGLWNLKSWARASAVVYCAFMVVWTLAVGTLTSLFEMPKSMKLAFEIQQQKISPEIARYATIAVVVASGCMFIITAAVYLGITIYLTRPNIKETFKAAAK